MTKAGRLKQQNSDILCVIKLFCYQNAHWQYGVYQNVMVSTCYHNIVKSTHTHATMHDI